MKIRNETLLFSCRSLFEKAQSSTKWESMMKTVRCRRTTVIDIHMNLLVLANGKWNHLMVRHKCAGLRSISVNIPFLDHSRTETRQNSSFRCDTVCLYQFLQWRRTYISPFNLESSRWLKMKRFWLYPNCGQKLSQLVWKCPQFGTQKFTLITFLLRFQIADIFYFLIN